MTFVEKRRLSPDEVDLLPLPRGIAREDVAEAWVESSGKIEVVMKGYLNRVVVRTSTNEEPESHDP